MTLNTALVAPMPSASESTAVMAKPGTATELPPRIAKVGDDGVHGVGLDGPGARNVDRGRALDSRPDMAESLTQRRERPCPASHPSRFACGCRR